MLSACAAVIIGLTLLLHLPLTMLMRLPLIACWLFAGVRQLDRQSRGAHRVSAIRLGVDDATVVDRQGRLSPARIMSGSVVLARFAWLRLKFADGLIYGELLRGDAAHDVQWRRLQILWRQGAATFGAPR